MCWRGRFADREYLCRTKARIGLAHDALGTIDKGEVALLHGTCVGEVDGLIEEFLKQMIYCCMLHVLAR